jgi:hypothetical protein
VLAAREDANAALRLLLEVLGHYGVARKDRDDQGVTVYLEEFSAVSDGARAAIDLAGRLRDAGVGVVSGVPPESAFVALEGILFGTALSLVASSLLSATTTSRASASRS